MFKKVIGLEIHAQIATKTKLFSRALVKESNPNSNVEWLDAGMPGSLPVVNQECIFMALQTSLALNMTINETSIFDRKHYFYQDSPLGYQITQFYQPIGVNGFLEFQLNQGRDNNANLYRIRINRLHIEADAGKSLYDNGDVLIDLNRSGIGLMEIVTEPDFSSAQEVVDFLKELKAILLTLGTCKCDMECGNLRVDINISLHRDGESFGTRVEIKNLNSFKFIAKAIEYESKLQEQQLISEGKIKQTTKLFDSKNGTTHEIREKEDSVDYRYFSDPDLLPIKLDHSLIEKYRANLPISPAKNRKKYMQMGVACQQAYALCEHPVRVAFFEQLIKHFDTKFISKASNWVVSELIGKLASLNIELEEFIINRSEFADQFAYIIKLCETQQISRINAKQALDHLITTRCEIKEFIEKNHYVVQINKDEIIKIIQELLKKSSDEVEKYKNGKISLLMYFVGQVMKATQGKGDPELIKVILLEELK